MKQILIASDHAGYPLKEDLKSMFPKLPWKDLGTFNADSVDYPDYGFAVAQALKNEPDDFGVLVCGSGVGVSIAANRYKHIRAVLAQTEDVARLGRQHNNANVLCLGSRTTPTDIAGKILEAFLIAKPDMAERHQNRIHKLSNHGE